ncbi:hypothetical protein [Burkholderia sp. Bp9090]|uniref:hypothetical protein n=1 Tax=Burkholderia sp. Bp9090 TaxID=2184567 RepID=UPI000F5E8FF1|nr:hypothetical protein [Burkholderia sp. Bp9090]
MNSAKGSGAAALTRTADFRALLAKLLYERGPDFALEVLVVTTTPGWEENRRAQICDILSDEARLAVIQRMAAAQQPEIVDQTASTTVIDEIARFALEFRIESKRLRQGAAKTLRTRILSSAGDRLPRCQTA